jgi:uncharacterized protein
MVSFPEIKEYMRKQAEADRGKKSVQVTGPSIEEALQQASIELGAPIKKIEYEVLEKGSKGALGFGKKDCILIAYQAQKAVEMESFESDEDMFMDFGESQAAEPVDIDGEAIVRLFPDGAMVKVLPPKGEGKKATKREALDKLHERAVHDVDEKMIEALVNEAAGEYIKVGEFIYNPVNDAVVSVDITDFEMKGIIVAQPPGPGGADLSYDTIESYLKNNSVIHGIQEEKVKDFIDHPVYSQPVTLAEGTPPVNGEDAKIMYNFETDTSKVRLKEKDGKVDFKELNQIQNVVEGQVLAKKVPAGQGEDGRTVTGRLLPAKPGKDVELGAGQNVKISDDKLSLIAKCNGQVMLSAGKVNVEPVYVIQGDVNMKVGNIVHLGSVVVKGNVEDGFKVKASGNIEVMGTVGKCELDAEGDIIVHQGITGKSGGNINTGKTVWAKFIENAVVQSGENVVATDGIINSHVDANKKIVCMSRGKRAKIVGGKLRAAEEVIAETFGSVAGSETIVEVGYDPKSKARLAELEAEKETVNSEMEEINLNISTLAKQRKTRKKLPEEKEKYLKELISRKKELDGDLKNLNEEISTVQNYLASLKSIGKVSAAKKVFPGVKVFIKDAVLEVRSEFKAVTFINEANVVKVTKYEEPEENFERKE